jgi:DNA polymerase
LAGEVVKELASRFLRLAGQVVDLVDTVERRLDDARKAGKYPEITPEVLERVSAYNKIDVDGLTAIHRATEGLSERERQVWELDQTINRRGVGVDTDFVRAAKRIAERSKGALFEEFAGLTKDPERTDDPGLSPHQVTKTRKWLKSRGFTLENMESETVEDALKNLVLPDDVKRVLQIRLITAPTSLMRIPGEVARESAMMSPSIPI